MMNDDMLIMNDKEFGNYELWLMNYLRSWVFSL